jgi:DNA-binding MarR family transcriptional regulator
MEREKTELIRRILELDLTIYQALSHSLPREWLSLDLTMPQLKVLLILFSGGPCRVSALASALGVGLPTVTGILDRLVQQGLVRREEDPNDRRVVISRLTEKGQEVSDRLHQLGRARWSEILGTMSLEELRTVAQALDIIHRAALRWVGSRREEEA